MDFGHHRDRFGAWIFWRSVLASVGDSSEYQRLRNEYHQTIRVLSVLAGLLLKHEHGDTIEISDKALLEAPDIEAWRDTQRSLTCIRVVE